MKDYSHELEGLIVKHKDVTRDITKSVDTIFNKKSGRPSKDFMIPLFEKVNLAKMKLLILFLIPEFPKHELSGISYEVLSNRLADYPGNDVFRKTKMVGGLIAIEILVVKLVKQTVSLKHLRKVGRPIFSLIVLAGNMQINSHNKDNPTNILPLLKTSELSLPRYSRLVEEMGIEILGKFLSVAAMESGKNLAIDLDIEKEYLVSVSAVNFFGMYITKTGIENKYGITVPMPVELAPQIIINILSQLLVRQGYASLSFLVNVGFSVLYLEIYKAGSAVLMLAKGSVVTT